MGIDFIAGIEHNLNNFEKIFDFKKKLEKEYFRSIFEANNYFQKVFGFENNESVFWNLDTLDISPEKQWEEKSCIGINIHRFSFKIYKNVIVFHSPLRWYYFLTDLKTRIVLRKIFFEISLCFNKKIAVYAPDNSSDAAIPLTDIDIHNTLDKVILEFENMNILKTKINCIYEPEYLDNLDNILFNKLLDTYFIDDFSDLKI